MTSTSSALVLALTATLPRLALDWAVAKIEDIDLLPAEPRQHSLYSSAFGNPYGPSTDWAVGGPIIDRADIELERSVCLERGVRFARMRAVDPAFGAFGGSNLDAAMRCYVTARLGEKIEVPAHLLIT